MALEAATGKNLIGEEVGTIQRVLGGAGAALPVFAKVIEKVAPLIRGSMKAEKAAKVLRGSSRRWTERLRSPRRRRWRPRWLKSRRRPPL